MAKPKGVQVSGTITPELAAALEDHRWTARKTRSEIVTTALEEYARNHQLNVQPAAAAPSPDSPEAAFSDQA